ncbi:hypothetical protein AB0J80_31225 [Actinoplanes sp. NPDC049548]|uniref:hypothetical protein n=1 Tax=Actinoplanes sp. NPDC049548 TaxID=3155152 RepID=UPI00341AA79A
MRRIWSAALPALLVLPAAGCGVEPSGVTDMRDAPTGLASGPTLYLVDDDGRLRAERRTADSLGTIPEAVSLLLSLSKKPGDQIAIPDDGPTTVFVNAAPDLIQLRVPLATYEVTALGIDQIVCTALGVWVQSGGSRTTQVQLEFTVADPETESDKRRTCPLIG